MDLLAYMHMVPLLTFMQTEAQSCTHWPWALKGAISGTHTGKWYIQHAQTLAHTHTHMQVNTGIREETLTPSHTPKSTAGKELPAPFVEEGLPPVPPKLVNKIQRREFVDMAELLRDNVEAEQRRVGQGGVAAAVCSWMSEKTSGRREVPDILSWMQCFSMYACILGEKYSQKVRELWAYRSLIVREA